MRWTFDFVTLTVILFVLASTDSAGVRLAYAGVLALLLADLKADRS